MSESDELDQLRAELQQCRRRICELEEQLATAKIDIEVLALEVSCLDRQRLADARRLAGIDKDQRPR
jgi:hypothetical protein